MHRKNIVPYLVSLTIALTIIGITVGNYYLANNLQIRDEFAPRWLSARIWIQDGTLPYDDDIVIATNNMLTDRGYSNESLDGLRFTEPAYNLILYLMFGLLEYDIAHAIWLTLIEVAVGASVYFSIKISGWKLHQSEFIILLLLGLLWYPGVKNILVSSSQILFVFMMILAIYLILNEQGTAAGFLMAFVFGTIEVSILVAIFMIVWQLSRRDSSVLWSYVAGLGFLFVISFILFPGWLAEWFRVFLMQFPQLSWFNTPLMRIASALPGAELPLNYGLHIGFAFYLLLEWFGAFGKKGRIIAWKAALTLSVAYLFNFQSQSAYLLLLFPALFMILRFFCERWKIFGRIISWLILISLALGYWIIFKTRGGWYLVEPSMILLSLPLIVLVGLNWIRWWALQRPDPILN